MQFLDAKSLEHFGQWLFRRWYHLKEKKHQAKTKLVEIDIELSILRAEWASQIQEQTRPVPRTSFHFYSLVDLVESVLQEDRERRGNAQLMESLHFARLSS